MKEGIIVLGHGSRAPDAGLDMERVVAGLRQALPQDQVEAAYMSLQEPSLHQAFENCLNAGVKTIIVMPYFLHNGIHIKEDIPAMLQDLLAGREKDLQITFANPLGFDDSLVALTLKRIAEARV